MAGDSLPKEMKMNMTRQNLPATKSGIDLMAMLIKATQEGKAAAADSVLYASKIGQSCCKCRA
jgi:hypothetical protein